jgi:hypothetical protein
MLPVRRRLLTSSLLIGLSAVALFGVVPTHAQSAACKLPTKPNVLIREGSDHLPDSRLLQYWDLDNPESLWLTSESQPRLYARYLSQVRKIGFKTDPIAALRASPSVNNEIVLQSSSEWIRPSNCLEKLLIGIQNSRVSIARDPTEFVSVVLDQPGTDRIRVYFYSVNRNGIGAMTPLTKLVEVDMKQGWQVNFVLHNHAFHFSDPALNGIVAPSVPDANFNFNFFKSHGLPQARITNGINTVEIPSAAFDRFQRE